MLLVVLPSGSTLKRKLRTSPVCMKVSFSKKFFFFRVFRGQAIQRKCHELTFTRQHGNSRFVSRPAISGLHAPPLQRRCHPLTEKKDLQKNTQQRFPSSPQIFLSLFYRNIVRTGKNLLLQKDMFSYLPSRNRSIQYPGFLC